jgi:hypothetical protein
LERSYREQSPRAIKSDSGGPLRRHSRRPPKGLQLGDIHEIRRVADLPQDPCGKTATFESPSSAP